MLVTEAPNTPEPKGKSFPITRLVPNMITLAGLCCGLTAVRFAMVDRWELSVTMIFIAAVLDFFDGAVARLLKATSEFGAQLDSLADIVSFGIAPALVMHLWSLHQIKAIGWSVSLFYVICCALRLARFNTALHSSPDEKPSVTSRRKQYFTGVPSPAGAILCIWPLILGLEGITFFQDHVFFCMCYVTAIGGLMVSRIPTFSLKSIRITSDMVLPIMLIVCISITIFIVEPWAVLAVGCFGYVISIGISYSLAQRQLPPSALFSLFKRQPK